MIDRKVYYKEGMELKNIYHHYIDKRSEIMKNIHIKAEDVFGQIQA